MENEKLKQKLEQNMLETKEKMSSSAVIDIKPANIQEKVDKIENIQEKPKILEIKKISFLTLFENPKVFFYLEILII